MEQNKVKKSKIPYFFFAFFAVVFAVDFFYIYISKKTWRGVVVDDSYQKGLQYNEVLQDKKMQKNLGWKMTIFFENKGNKSGILQVDLTDKNSIKIKNAKVVVKLKLPVQEGFDFERQLEFDGNNYRANINFVQKGQWDFVVKAVANDNKFIEVKRFIVQ